MIDINRILFPTDFSETSIVAFDQCMHLASMFNAHIELIHIIEAEQGERDESFYKKHGNVTSEFQNGFERFYYFDELMYDHNLSTERISYHTYTGKVLESIINAADELKVDMVVMASQGSSFLEKQFFGSTTTELMEHSPVPVYTIPYHFRRHLVGMKVAVSTALLEEDYAAMNYIIEIFKDHPETQLYSVHIDYNHIAEFSDNFKNWKNNFLADEVESHLIDDGKYLRGINTFVEEYEIDTLVMLTHKRGFMQEVFHKSIAKEVSNNKNTCIIALPEEYLKSIEMV